MDLEDGALRCRRLGSMRWAWRLDAMAARLGRRTLGVRTAAQTVPKTVAATVALESD
jgi:hypothetical protein